MFIFAIERSGASHILDYVKPKTLFKQKMHLAICSKLIKAYGANFFAADNVFPGLCNNCKLIYNEMYLDDLNYDPATALSSLNNYLIKKCTLSEMQIDTPQLQYNYCVTKGWGKLVRLKRSVKR